MQTLGIKDQNLSDAELPSITQLPQARLVVLPASSPLSIVDVVAVLESMISAILDDAVPATGPLW